MASKILSIIPYYGGKAKMAELICDMLDYNNTDIYIEPFGGGARVLLNKQRHKTDIYCDSSLGLNALFECLSDEEKGLQLIAELEDTEPSAELFHEAVKFRNIFDDNVETVAWNDLCSFMVKMGNKYNVENTYRDFSRSHSGQYELLKSIDELLSKLNKTELAKYRALTKIYSNPLEDDYNETVAWDNLYSFMVKMGNQYKIEDTDRVFSRMRSHSGKYKLPKSIDELLSKLNKTELAKYRALTKTHNKLLKYADTTENIAGTEYYDNIIKLAKATFIAYQLSYCGNGKGISKSKVDNVSGYHNAVERLYTALEQLEGVKTVCSDANIAFLKDINSIENTSAKITDYSMGWYLNNERVMMYLDPSYLQPSVQYKDTEKTEPCDMNCTDACRKMQDSSDKDLGAAVYKQSWSHEEHEKFLKLIRDAKCKILLSNYDVCLYNRNLSGYKNWHKMQIETTTSVASVSTKSNARTEVLWYNY
ncbi:MAG: DNA adenine methylase [Hydrogenoanaerobacterium sp.]